MVFFVHYGQTFGNPLITRFGQMGCSIFIMVSGYTCSLALEKSKSLKGFFERRIKSIVPGFYTTLSVCIMINFICKKIYDHPFVGEGHTGIVSVLCNFLLIHGVLPFCNNNVFPGGWFIGTIVLLYIIHPIIISTFKKFKRRYVVTVVLMLLAMLTTFAVNYALTGSLMIHNNSFAYFFFLNHLGCYMIGINLYYDERKVEKTVVAQLLLLFCLGGSLFLFYRENVISYALLPTMVGIVGACLYMLIKEADLKGTGYKIVCSIGKKSYMIYLVHTVVVWKGAQFARRLLDRAGIENDKIQFAILVLPSIALIWSLIGILEKTIQVEKRVIVYWIHEQYNKRQKQRH